MWSSTCSFISPIVIRKRDFKYMSTKEQIQLGNLTTNYLALVDADDWSPPRWGQTTVKQEVPCLNKLNWVFHSHFKREFPMTRCSGASGTVWMYQVSKPNHIEVGWGTWPGFTSSEARNSAEQMRMWGLFCISLLISSGASWIELIDI